MKKIDSPDRIPLPWADGAVAPYVNDIPTGSQVGVTNGAASFTDGFPPLNFVPIAAGGYPPRGADANGILRQITAGLQWLQAGVISSFDQDFADVIGGYPQDAVLKSNQYPGLLWTSLVDDNVADPDSGSADWLPFNRWRLTSDITLYVNGTTGSNSNDGLGPTTPFQTITKACSVVQSFLDLAGFTVRVRIAAGSYSEPVSLAGRVIGVGSAGAQSVIFQASDGAVNITTVSPFDGAVLATQGAAFTLAGSGWNLSSPFGQDSSTVACMQATIGGSILLDTGCVITYNVGRDAHVVASSGGYIQYSAGVLEIINSAAPIHWFNGGGSITFAGEDVQLTFNDSPSFSTAFVVASTGLCTMYGLSFSGTCLGTRYISALNGTIDTGSGADPSYFPGNVAGVTDTGGIYA